MGEIKPLGRRFFWVKSTGNIIAQRSEMAAGIESTKEEDFDVYIQLRELDPNTIEMTTFEPGQFAEEFAKAKSWCFDPGTGKILFIYPDPDDSENPDPVPQPPLTEQIKKLQEENNLMKAQNTALSDRSDFIEDVIAEMAQKVYQ
ncbi:hypothetical protein [Paenibacillus azoreducens]|uniref:Uncharacterized protein n=1 Tax=Paenibacillus azoreducens TaxID=116718 RepID=A0A920CNA4_9BACL|nr:hypothetical protein [Paenibacillus azoreducens]GIO47246.1 hypothetical protein J34TS1_20110 [Paenibacillus azoreducens]